MALVTYSSSSGTESEEEEGPPQPKTAKLTSGKKLVLPSAISCLSKPTHKSPVADPSQHDGRIRSFEHERGNWATYVYIPVDLDAVEDLQSALQEFFKDSIDLKCPDDIHISLTRTVVLRHHWIESFIKSLQDALIASERFPVEFKSLKVYTNDEKTRTFIGLVAGDMYFEKIHKLMTRVDTVMRDYRLETFYKDPSFHASILWCLGDQKKLLEAKLDEINTLLSDMRKGNTDDFQIRVDDVGCKSGNRSFQIKLK